MLPNSSKENTNTPDEIFYEGLIRDNRFDWYFSLKNTKHFQKSISQFESTVQDNLNRLYQAIPHADFNANDIIVFLQEEDTLPDCLPQSENTLKNTDILCIFLSHAIQSNQVNTFIMLCEQYKETLLQNPSNWHFQFMLVQLIRLEWLNKNNSELQECIASLFQCSVEFPIQDECKNNFFHVLFSTLSKTASEMNKQCVSQYQNIFNVVIAKNKTLLEQKNRLPKEHITPFHLLCSHAPSLNAEYFNGFIADIMKHITPTADLIDLAKMRFQNRFIGNVSKDCLARQFVEFAYRNEAKENEDFRVFIRGEMLFANTIGKLKHIKLYSHIENQRRTKEMNYAENYQTPIEIAANLMCLPIVEYLMDFVLYPNKEKIMAESIDSDPYGLFNTLFHLCTDACTLSTDSGTAEKIVGIAKKIIELIPNFTQHPVVQLASTNAGHVVLLHHIFQRRSEYLKIAALLLKHLPPAFLIAKNSVGNMPFHSLLLQHEEDENSLAILDMLLPHIKKNRHVEYGSRRILLSSQH